jgi:hypothetical protein
MTDTATTIAGGDEEYAKSGPVDREINGPLDETEAGAIRPSVDLGALRIEPKRGMQRRLEIDKNNNRVIAVTLEHDSSTVQLQPFAAPRSSGLWHGIRAQIMDQVTKQGGTVAEVEGPFGPEVSAKVPVQSGSSFGSRPVRFVGIDGPRWFLRAVIAGPAATSPEAAEIIHTMIRRVVVVRGNTPLPPRDLLPLRVPPTGETPVTGEA